jgi:formamidopyrimidine-DNA glycosylase
MPELPDLLHIVTRLREALLGRHATAERVREPVVLRFTVRGNLSLLLGRPLHDVFRKSHFIVFRFEGLDLAVNPMLAGRFRLATASDREEAALCFALEFEPSGSPPAAVELRYLDDKKMGKAYLIATSSPPSASSACSSTAATRSASSCWTRRPSTASATPTPTRSCSRRGSTPRPSAAR